MSFIAERGPLLMPGKVARAVSLVMLGYWGLYALLTPVTNFDSQTYNLARLALAERHGFFGNPYWTSAWQVMHPWSFDAVHLPSLWLGWGHALPSFACFVGLCVITFRMVRSTVGGTAAWCSLLGLLALPCLVYQATSTKNDLAVVFFFAVWGYAYWRWTIERRRRHLVWMVLAIGCLAGAKITGALYSVGCALWTMKVVWRDRKLTAWVLGGLGLSLVLFGSVETYVECQRYFEHPLGPKRLVAQLGNRDGWRGGLANLSRYTAGSLYLGQSEWGPSTRAITAVANAERAVLERAGLSDAGASVFCQDRNLFFFQSGFEELSGFGPFGTVGLCIAVAALVRWRPREAWWRLAIGASVVLVVLSLTVGYAIWNNRYLIGPFALTTIACVFLLWGGDGRAREWLRGVFVALATLCAISAPLMSFNRTPASLVRAVTDRRAFETCMVPAVGAVREILNELCAATPDCRIAVGTTNDSPILHYLTDESLDVSFFARAALPSMLESGVLRTGDLVILDDAVEHPTLVLVAAVWAPRVVNRASATGKAPPIGRHVYRYQRE
ncbi:MAG: hypothetical protein QM691_10230 [Opitutaceae bacterium]